MIVTLDTGILVRATSHSNGPARRLLETIAGDPAHILVLSPLILGEAGKAHAYPRVSALLRITSEQTHEHVAYLQRVCRIVDEPAGMPVVLTDPKDDPVVYAALGAGADVLCAFQVATYRQLCPGANGKARVDTLVATKSPQVVTQEYTVSPADLKMTRKLYPLVREAMREGIYLPNRASNLCSYKHCAFAAACETEFGGRVKGNEEE